MSSWDFYLLLKEFAKPPRYSKSKSFTLEFNRNYCFSYCCSPLVTWCINHPVSIWGIMREMGFLYLWAVAGPKLARAQVPVCMNWELLWVFHGLFLVKLIIALSHSGKSGLYFLMFRAVSVCQHKALSCVMEGEASDHDGEKQPSTWSRYLKMLNVRHWHSEWQFTQKQERKYFCNCSLSQIP